MAEKIDQVLAVLTAENSAATQVSGYILHPRWQGARRSGRALSLLPEALRTALLLHSLEGFTYPEIAEILGCPVSTVCTRIARARQKLLLKLHSRARTANLGRRRNS